MSQKNEAPILILTLLITTGVIGLGYVFFFGVKLPFLSPNNPNQSSQSSQNSSNNTPQISGGNFTEVQQVPSGLFNYGGSTSWAPIREIVDAKIQSDRPEFKLRYVESVGKVPSSTNGIKMLIDGKIAIAQSSRPLKDSEYQQAKQRGFNLKQIAVAIDGIAVAVNPNLNIPGLTLTQLKDIYTGKITNWQQVGGANLPIIPFSRPANTGGTVELFTEEILQNNRFGKNVQFVSNTTEALRKLGANPGGIYFASAPEVVPQCTIKSIALGRQIGQFILPYQGNYILPSQCPSQRNQLNITAFQQGSYPLTRNLFVIIKENGQIEQKAGEAYGNLLLSNHGQELINQAGFVRLR